MLSHQSKSNIDHVVLTEHTNLTQAAVAAPSWFPGWGAIIQVLLPSIVSAVKALWGLGVMPTAGQIGAKMAEQETGKAA